MNANQKITVPRLVTVEVVVTSEYKNQLSNEIQSEMLKIDEQVNILSENFKFYLQECKLSDRMAEIPSLEQAVNDDICKLNQKHSELFAQLELVQNLHVGETHTRGFLQSTVTIRIGDNFEEKISSKVILKNGIVSEIVSCDSDDEFPDHQPLATPMSIMKSFLNLFV